MTVVASEWRNSRSPAGDWRVCDHLGSHNAKAKDWLGQGNWRMANEAIYEIEAGWLAPGEWMAGAAARPAAKEAWAAHAGWGWLGIRFSAFGIPAPDWLLQ